MRLTYTAVGPVIALAAVATTASANFYSEHRPLATSEHLRQMTPAQVRICSMGSKVAEMTMSSRLVGDPMSDVVATVLGSQESLGPTLTQSYLDLAYTVYEEPLPEVPPSEFDATITGAAARAFDTCVDNFVEIQGF